MLCLVNERGRRIYYILRILRTLLLNQWFHIVSVWRSPLFVACIHTKLRARLGLGPSQPPLYTRQY